MADDGQTDFWGYSAHTASGWVQDGQYLVRMERGKCLLEDKEWGKGKKPLRR